MKKDYYITYGNIGFVSDKIEKEGNIIWFFRDGIIVTFIEPKFAKLKYLYKDKYTIYFKIIDVFK